MSQDLSSLNRCLNLLTFIDKYAEITVADLMRETDCTYSTVYRYVKVLRDFGLIQRGSKAGRYVAGPRYNRQDPESRFDDFTKRRKQIDDVMRLYNEPRAKRLPMTKIARMLGINYVRVRKIVNDNIQRAG